MSRFVSPSWVAAGMIGLTVPNGCRELSRMVERPSQRAIDQHVLAQVKFGQSLEHEFNDPNVVLTTTGTDSSLTLIVQDSTIVAMSDRAKAAFARRAALFVRDHYDEYRDVRRVNIRRASDGVRSGTLAQTSWRVFAASSQRTALT